MELADIDEVPHFFNSKIKIKYLFILQVISEINSNAARVFHRYLSCLRHSPAQVDLQERKL